MTIILKKRDTRPSKAKTTKEMVINAAFEVARAAISVIREEISI